MHPHDYNRQHSMLMDLFFHHVPITTRRRIHFNAAMLHINVSLAALERERAAQEATQAAAYAARVTRDTPWALLRRHDPEYEKQRRARLARMAVRREQRERQQRSAEQHLSRLAGAQ